MNFLVKVSAALLVSAGAVSAAPVNLSGWTAETGPGSPAANWSLARDNNSVRQTVNSAPSVFFDGAASSQGKSLSGSIRVNTSSDDDFIGFVIGMDAGELDGTAASVDYWLVDWKQNDQAGSGFFSPRGLSLSHVTGATTDEYDFWEHRGVVNEVQRAANLGDTGWSDLTEYTFELIFTSSLIEVFVEGQKEISYSSADHGSAFLDGGFGFYNYSQENVTYAGIEEDVVVTPAPVPLPAGMPLVLAGLGAFAVVRRRQQK